MKRYFLLLFCAYVVVNTCYNLYIYLSSEKIEGRMVWVAKKSQAVEFFYDGEILNVNRSKWSYIPTLDENDLVTVLLIPDEVLEASDIEINTFFQFWFTFYDMIFAFLVCLLGTMILSTYFPEKEEKIEEWK